MNSSPSLARLVFPCVLLVACKDDPPPIPTAPPPVSVSAAPSTAPRTPAGVRGDIAAVKRSLAALEKQAPRQSDMARAKKLNLQIATKKKQLAMYEKELADLTQK